MSPGVDSRASSDALMDTASSTLALLQRFISVLSSTETVDNASVPQDSPDPLDVLHTSATLLKAHTTKLSLLMINKPFTPSAIKTVVSDIANTCIPGMMSAVEICHPSIYGHLLHREVKMRVRRVFKELEAFMKEIVQLCSAGDTSASDTRPAARDSLSSTGVVWEACDALMELQQLGLPGLAVRKAREFQDLIKDALAELKEWGEDEVDEEKEDDADDNGEDDEDLDDLAKIFGKMKALPRTRPDLRATLDKSIQKLRMTSQLYKELSTKRLMTFPTERSSKAQSSDTTRLDQIMDRVKKIPPQTDEMASSFYELSNNGAVKRLDEIVRLGEETAKISRLDWKGGEDEFSVWSDKWAQLIKTT